MRLKGLALTLLMPIAGLFPAAAHADSAPLKWHPWFEIGGYAGNERSRGEAVLWAPLMQSDRTLLFTDIRGKLFDEDQSEGNFALGYREMLSGGWNLGAWTSYDLRRTSLGSTLGQVSFGLEALHPWYDLRANAYLPTEQSKVVSDTPIAFAEMTGSDIFLVSGQHMITRELAFHGIDGEVGVKVPLDQFALDTQQHELRLYAGAFAFDNDRYDGTIAGPKARMEWRVYDVVPQWYGSRLTLEAEYAWDEERDDQVEAGLRLRLPFGAQHDVVRLNAQELRMTEGLERDTDIVAKGQTAVTGEQKRERVEDARTGADFDHVVVVANGNDIQAAADSVGANSLVIVKGGSTYTPVGPSIDLYAGQTLQGGGSTIMVRGTRTGLVVPFTAPGSAPTIVSCGCDIILMNNATHVAGVRLDGGGVGIPDAVSTVVIRDVRISNADYGIIAGLGAHGIEIENVAITDSLIGMAFLDSNEARIRDVTVSNMLAAGIGFGYGNTIAMENVRFDNAGGFALSMSGDNTVSMSNSSFSGAYAAAIEFQDINNTLSGSGNVHSAAGGFCDGMTAPGDQTGSFGFSGSPGHCP